RATPMRCTCTSPRSPQPSRPLPTPSSWSIKPAGTCPRASSCRPISPSFCCRRSAQSSTRSRTSGSSCATTGSPTASSNPTTISSTIVVRHGTSSSISLGASCPSDCANGPTGSDQWDLVLIVLELLVLLGIWVALPLVPAILIYRYFPNTQVAASGPLAGLTVKASGAFAAYLVVFLLIFGLVSPIKDVIGSGM